MTTDEPTQEDDAGPPPEVTLRVVGKGGKVGDVPIGPELKEILDEYLAARHLLHLAAVQP